jgi:hypothetical protein
VRTETVTRLRDAPALSAYSGQESTADPEFPAVLPITTLAPAEPRPSSEPVQDARNSVMDGWTLYLPEGSDVRSSDRLRVRGEEYDVLGEPAAWMGAGLVVQCGRRAG